MSDPDFWLMPIGIPWCRQENYDAFLSIFEDREDLPLEWQGFAKTAEEAEQHYKAKGHFVVRVDIDPHTFPRWCQSKGYRVNARARARFARDVANVEADHDGR